MLYHDDFSLYSPFGKVELEPVNDDDDDVYKEIDADNIRFTPDEIKNLAWNDPELEHLKRALKRAYTMEQKASKAPGFWSIASRFNTGGLIRARCINLFPNRPSGDRYLQFIEVLIRSKVFSPREYGFRILNVNEDPDSLIQACINIDINCQVFTISDDLVEQRSEDAKKRKIINSKVMSRLAYHKQTGNEADLIVASCAHFSRIDSYKMLNNVQSYRECQQMYSFIILALELLYSGGSLVLRVHGSSDGYFVSNMYILYLFFEELFLLKPTMSNDSDMELFVVAKRFQQHKFVKLQGKIKDSLDYMVRYQWADRVGLFPLRKIQIPPRFTRALNKTLGKIVYYIIECKIRNAQYTWSNHQIRLERERFADHYRIRAVTKWMLYLRLDKIYFSFRKECKTRKLGNEIVNAGKEPLTHAGSDSKTTSSSNVETGSASGGKTETAAAQQTIRVNQNLGRNVMTDMLLRFHEMWEGENVQRGGASGYM